MCVVVLDLDSTDLSSRALGDAVVMATVPACRLIGCQVEVCVSLRSMSFVADTPVLFLPQSTHTHICQPYKFCFY